MNPNHYFLPNPNGRSPRSFRPNPSISANFRRQSKVFKLYQAPSTLINHPPFLSGSTDGRYFAESVAEGLRIEEADSGNLDSRVFAINLRLKKGEGLRYFTATNDMGVAIFTNLNATAQNWLYKPDWNMMRVTRRGPGVPAEWFTCDLSSHFFYIKLR